MKFFDYRHIVTLEETNVVGNVYYVNHVKWQGRCRELFLREHAPELVAQLSHGFVMATISCRCEYFAELHAFDEVIVRMRLADLAVSRMALNFEYFRSNAGSDQLVARGYQQIACMQTTSDGLVPAPVPVGLRRALASYDVHGEQLPCY